MRYMSHWNVWYVAPAAIGVQWSVSYTACQCVATVIYYPYSTWLIMSSFILFSQRLRSHVVSIAGVLKRYNGLTKQLSERWYMRIHFFFMEIAGIVHHFSCHLCDVSTYVDFFFQELNGFKSLLSTFLWASIAKLYFEVSDMWVVMVNHVFLTLFLSMNYTMSEFIFQEILIIHNNSNIIQ